MSARKVFRVALRKFEPFEAAIRKQWEDFRRATGCTLELQAEACDLHPLYEELFEKQGLLRGDWDVAMLNTDWLAGVDQSGAALDLAPFIAQNPPDGYPEGWTPSLLRFQEFEGRILGLPFHDGPESLIYRTDLFENPAERAAYQARFGRILKVPETWEEFRDLARFFHRPEKNLYGTVFAAYPDGHNTVYDFCLQLWTRGGEVLESGQVRLDSSAAVRGLEFYRAMLNDAAACHPQSRTFDSVKSGWAFARGEVALMINWFGFAAMAETVEGSNVKGRVGVATIPHDPASRGASLNVYWLLSIGRGSPHAETAYQFLRHAASAEMDKLVTLEGGIGCRKTTWEDPEINRRLPFYHRLKDLHRDARELPRLAGWAAIASVIDELVLQVINTSESVQSLDTSAQEKVERLLAQR